MRRCCASRGASDTPGIRVELRADSDLGLLLLGGVPQAMLLSELRTGQIRHGGSGLPSLPKAEAGGSGKSKIVLAYTRSSEPAWPKTKPKPRASKPSCSWRQHRKQSAQLARPGSPSEARGPECLLITLFSREQLQDAWGAYPRKYLPSGYLSSGVPTRRSSLGLVCV